MLVGSFLIISNEEVEGSDINGHFLNFTHASYWGDNDGDYSGAAVSSAGDVNGDGYDDFLIGSYGNDAGGASSGHAYLILGKAAPWYMKHRIETQDASFIGEDAGDYAGYSLAGAGDVNGDGYDDILIGAFYDDDGGSNAGQTYLILGKSTGWSLNTDLSTGSMTSFPRRATLAGLYRPYPISSRVRYS